MEGNVGGTRLLAKWAEEARNLPHFRSLAAAPERNEHGFKFDQGTLSRSVRLSNNSIRKLRIRTKETAMFKFVMHS